MRIVGERVSHSQSRPKHFGVRSVRKRRNESTSGYSQPMATSFLATIGDVSILLAHLPRCRYDFTLCVWYGLVPCSDGFLEQSGKNTISLAGALGSSSLPCAPFRATPALPSFPFSRKPRSPFRLGIPCRLSTCSYPSILEIDAIEADATLIVLIITVFRVLINLGLKSVDGEYSQKAIDAELDWIETFYGEHVGVFGPTSRSYRIPTSLLIELF